MILKISNNAYKYDLESLCRVFFPFEKINDAQDNGQISINATEQQQGGSNILTISGEVFDQSITSSESVPLNSDDFDNECKRMFSIALYKALQNIGTPSQWGILTGVRPAKVMHNVIKELGEENADEYFRSKLLVTDKKTSLTHRVTKSEDTIIALSSPSSFSLYISIPFCPTRCSYCSFVSHSVKNAGAIIQPYVENLCEEIAASGIIAKELGLKLETIYFGGGTPTTLTSNQLESIIEQIEASFDFSHLREFTVEAGRPDTVTKEKLVMLKNHNVSRISINPQSFNDDVLMEIGRNHSSEQTVDAFKLAREVGFDNINMDLIAGLPTDTLQSFENSVDRAISLGAESVTVHTLSRKRAAFLFNEDMSAENSDAKCVSDMVDYSAMKLDENGYFPYYMYRQSKSRGNLENVGWCKTGSECLYNVFMMDETHTVLSCGAGAVTKLRQPCGAKIERIYNFKYPYEYNNDFLEMLYRKKRIKCFYEEYPLKGS